MVSKLIFNNVLRMWIGRLWVVGHSPSSRRAPLQHRESDVVGLRSGAGKHSDAATDAFDKSHGGSVTESTTAAKSPALLLKPLKPLQGAEGWLGFTVPKGKAASKLEYDYNGTISWDVG